MTSKPKPSSESLRLSLESVAAIFSIPQQYAARHLFRDTQRHASDEMVALDLVAERFQIDPDVLALVVAGRDRLLKGEQAAARCGVSERSFAAYSRGHAEPELARYCRPVVDFPGWLVRWSERALTAEGFRALELKSAHRIAALKRFARV